MTNELKHNVTEFSQNTSLPAEKYILNFYATWHEPCNHTNNVFKELSRQFPTLLFYSVNAEDFEDLAIKYDIEQVPTFVVVDGDSVERVEGANPTLLSELVQKHSTAVVNKPLAATETKDWNKKLEKLINSQPLMIFIKGTPTQPKCGFSRKLIEILTELNCQYGSFDILSDPEVRSGLKEYSDWPTFPQVYINGELVGGLDIIVELQESGELKNMLPADDIEGRLKKLTNQAPVMLFMKGDRDTPRCGFSRQIVQILNDLNVKYETFDILEDDEVRQGLKEYSDWPTYPQLYHKGELLGGLDIVKEMESSGELMQVLSQ